MSTAPPRPRRALGPRPQPSHSSSSTSSSSSSSSSSDALPSATTRFTPTNQSPMTATMYHSSSPPILLPPSSLYPSLPSSNKPEVESTSRSVTPKPPKPSLPSLFTGGALAVSSIGAPDYTEEDYDNSANNAIKYRSNSSTSASSGSTPSSLSLSPPSLPPLLTTGSIGLNLNFGSAAAPPAHNPISIRPPVIGGGGKKKPKLGLGLAIPTDSTPIGAMGRDDPDAVDTVENNASSSTAEELDGITIRAPHPQPPTGESGNHRNNFEGMFSQNAGSSGNAGYIPRSTADENRDKDESDEVDWSEAEQYLEDVARLGEGAGGEVFKVRDTRTNKILARKIIQARSTPPKQLVRELNFMSNTSNTNIIRFYGAYISPSSSEVKVIMELCEGGSLESIGERIKKLRGRVSEKVVGKIADGIFCGLDYLHSKRIIHRDIKPSNILMSRNGTVKLCDFGVSGELVDSYAKTFTGTSFYMAPERIRGAPYTIRSDVWSSGLTLLTLAQNRFPYPEDLMGIVELVSYLDKEEPPRLTDEEPGPDGSSGVRWSDGMKEFIAICMTKDGETRPSPKEVLQHPWLIESSKLKVNMSQWIREVWGWPDRGRLAVGGGGEGSRRPSAVRSPSAVRTGEDGLNQHMQGMSLS